MATTPASAALPASTSTTSETVQVVSQRRKSRVPRHLGNQLLFYLGVMVVLLIALFPFYWILRTSLVSNQRSCRESAAPTASSPPISLGSAYIDDFTQLHFLTPLDQQCHRGAGVHFGDTIVVASLAGYALARLPIRGAGAILTFILLAGFFPVLAMVGPLVLACCATSVC